MSQTKTVYLYRQRGHKPGDVHFWHETPLPLHMRGQWTDEQVFTFWDNGETVLSGRSRIIVRTTARQALFDEHYRCLRAFQQSPTPNLGKILSRLAKKLLKED